MSDIKIPFPFMVCFPWPCPSLVLELTPWNVSCWLFIMVENLLTFTFFTSRANVSFHVLVFFSREVKFALDHDDESLQTKDGVAIDGLWFLNSNFNTSFRCLRGAVIRMHHLGNMDIC